MNKQASFHNETEKLAKSIRRFHFIRIPDKKNTVERAAPKLMKMVKFKGSDTAPSEIVKRIQRSRLSVFG